MPDEFQTAKKIGINALLSSIRVRESRFILIVNIDTSCDANASRINRQNVPAFLKYSANASIWGRKEPHGNLFDSPVVVISTCSDDSGVKFVFLVYLSRELPKYASSLCSRICCGFLLKDVPFWFFLSCIPGTDV